MQKLVENLALKYYDKVVDLRHQIHMHPELEFEEENTAHLVCKILDEFLALNIKKILQKQEF